MSRNVNNYVGSGGVIFSGTFTGPINVSTSDEAEAVVIIGEDEDEDQDDN